MASISNHRHGLTVALVVILVAVCSNWWLSSRVVTQPQTSTPPARDTTPDGRLAKPERDGNRRDARTAGPWSEPQLSTPAITIRTPEGQLVTPRAPRPRPERFWIESVEVADASHWVYVLHDRQHPARCLLVMQRLLTPSPATMTSQLWPCR